MSNVRRGESTGRSGAAEDGESTSRMGHRGESGEHGELPPDAKPDRGEVEGQAPCNEPSPSPSSTRNTGEP